MYPVILLLPDLKIIHAVPYRCHSFAFLYFDVCVAAKATCTYAPKRKAKLMME